MPHQLAATVTRQPNLFDRRLRFTGGRPLRLPRSDLQRFSAGAIRLQPSSRRRGFPTLPRNSLDLLTGLCLVRTATRLTRTLPVSWEKPSLFEGLGSARLRPSRFSMARTEPRPPGHLILLRPCSGEQKPAHPRRLFQPAGNRWSARAANACTAHACPIRTGCRQLMGHVLQPRDQWSEFTEGLMFPDNTFRWVNEPTSQKRSLLFTVEPGF
jgi:hypothetical protein